MNTTLSATEARNRFFELLDQVIYKGEEIVVEKDGKGSVRIVPEQPRPTPEEVKKVLAEYRKTFAKAAKRKYWSVIDTPAWKKKERKYLGDLTSGKLT